MQAEAAGVRFWAAKGGAQLRRDGFRGCTLHGA